MTLSSTLATGHCSAEPRDRIFVKEYAFLLFDKIIAKSIDKKFGKYSGKIQFKYLQFTSKNSRLF